MAFFGTTTFNSLAIFQQVTFNGDVTFGYCTFKGDASFYLLTFNGSTLFGKTIFNGDASFGRVRFQKLHEFGPLLAYRGLDLDDTHFAEWVQIEASTPRMSCRRTRFPGGVQFRLRWACVVLDDTDFPAPSILVGAPLPNNELAPEEERIAKIWRQELTDEISERPQLLSLRRANVAGLGLSNVTVADCRFAGAHNLDKLRIESDISFAAAPPPLGLRGHRWAGRQVIAEERAWRSGWRTAPPSSQFVAPRTVLRLPACGRARRMTRGPARWSQDRSPGCTGRCARDARTPRMSRVPQTCTTARWRCAATLVPSAPTTPTANPA